MTPGSRVASTIIWQQHHNYEAGCHLTSGRLHTIYTHLIGFHPHVKTGPVAQLVRAPGLHPGGRGFESLRAHQFFGR